MSDRTPKQLAEDREATELATSLYRAVMTLEMSDTVLLNAVAGLLGALVAATAEPGDEEATMNLMMTQAQAQMQLQLRHQQLARTVGNA